MADETKTRQYWQYTEVKQADKSALKRMAAAENKTVDQLVQAITYPALEAEIKAFEKKEQEAKAAADAKAAEEKAKADANKPADTTTTAVDPKQFAGAAKS